MKTREQLEDDLASAVAGMNSGDIIDATAALEAFDKRKLIETVHKGLMDVINLMNESEGVAGLHLNGNLAPWSEFEQQNNGEWFSDFWEAVRVVDAEIEAMKGKENGSQS